MKRKKVISLLIAGVLVVGAIGVAYAWFTAKDAATKSADVYGVDDPSNPDAGIKVQWGGEGEFKFLPGKNVDTTLNIKSTANYDQYLRVKVEKVWKTINSDGKEVVVDRYYLTEDEETGNETITYLKKDEHAPQGVTPTPLNSNKIVLDLNSENQKNDSWSSISDDGYYYYNKVLSASELGTDARKTITSNLFNSIKLAQGDDDNYYKNLKFDIKVVAEAVQAEGGEKESIWEDAPEYLKNTQ